ncbi:long-chain-fatty-acid--CoA ligase [Flavilitoribacter nigricans]|uniref:Long-chain-fatty-acid--CoA ligase n=1 Tax=Flavilitoribacter nigricans (strain ATCC 23147 / DSM 23189 / NBRC 102662 / NCIMB 1420 / SS-2) TaxID=1122177 RepID=A0A2D0NFT0_FLAN2|nr:long-chain fatty acid--CoA ligase [Flavilitoribacter nigricans]PHN07362.1 long-chain-fatty-acid--CoA ligase [Flavilitoribacter nigricans DSM 23189 = NBRC 102662]
MINLSVLLEDSARKYPTKDAFVFMDTHVSFAQVNGAANQVANGLKAAGIQKGDRVALSCLNVPYFPMVYFGILKAGAIVVPMSVLLKREEIAYHLQDSGAKAYFCFEGTPELPMAREGYAGFEKTDACEQFYVITADPKAASSIEGTKTMGMLMANQSPVFENVVTSADDTAVIIYTSGTTGKPKGAELSHSNLVHNAILSVNILDLDPEDKQLIVLPLFHIFAMTVLMNAGLYRGSTSVLLPRFDAEQVLGLMEKHRISIFAGVPTMYWGLLNYENTKFDLKVIAESLKTCVSGGAALPVNVLENFEKKFNVPIYEGYGMSEGSPVVTFNQKAFGKKPGSVGTPVWGVEVKIVDADDNEVPVGEKGELVYRGHNVMKGYFNKPEANKKTLKNGWLHSGDVAIKDEDGFFFIVDRTKEMIIRKGLNVYPREIEEVMMQHDAVSMVAVIGVPNDEAGEEIKACVVLHKGHEIPEEDLKAWTKEHIAAYKYPRIIEYMDALPMSATGKILKKELR